MHEDQHSIGSWIDETFPGTDPESPRKALRALEEMVELCLASGAAPGQITKTVQQALENSCDVSPAKWQYAEKQPEKIPAEAADVLIVLYGVAHMRKFDIHAEVDKKMAVNRARRWKANGDGTGYHIKD